MIPTLFASASSANGIPALLASSSKRLRRGALQNIRFVSNRFPETRLAFSPLQIIRTFGMDLDGTGDSDLILEFSVGLNDSGEEVPLAVDLNLLDDVGAVSWSVSRFGSGYKVAS